jgi:hypothetical protein
MKKTLLQIGFGVTQRSVSNGSHEAAFYDESNERVDGRSILALGRRGLIRSFTTGGTSVRFALRLTEKGEGLFEEILDQQSRDRWR